MASSFVGMLKDFVTLYTGNCKPETIIFWALYRVTFFVLYFFNVIFCYGFFFFKATNTDVLKTGRNCKVYVKGND